MCILGFVKPWKQSSAFHCNLMCSRGFQYVFSWFIGVLPNTNTVIPTTHEEPLVQHLGNITGVSCTIALFLCLLKPLFISCKWKLDVCFHFLVGARELGYYDEDFMIISAFCCLTYNWRKIFGNKSELRTFKKEKVHTDCETSDCVSSYRRLNETDYINTRVFWTAVSVCSGPSVFLSFQCFSYICLSIDIWSIIYFCLYFLSDSDSQSLNRGHHWPAEASSLILLCLLKKASEWSFKCKLTALFCYFLYLSYFKVFFILFMYSFFTVKGVSEQTEMWDSRGAAGSHTLHLCQQPPSHSL